MFTTLGYIALRAAVWLLSLLPLRALYAAAGVLAWLARSVAGYRRDVVRRNLREAFPDRDAAWLDGVERRFYAFLADMAVETVKLASASPAWIRRHMRFENAGLVARALAEGRQCSVMLGHYCNWEWVTSLPLHLPPGSVAGQIYHPLENRPFDRLLLWLRSRFSARCIPMADTLPAILALRREGKAAAIGYIADQAPGYNGIHLFVDFLRHDTPVFTGAERISRMIGASFIYARMERPRRGEYVCRFEEIARDADALPRFEPTRRYFSLLEAQIEERPEFWLWSHRRWKRGREGFMDFHGADAARQLRRL